MRKQVSSLYGIGVRKPNVVVFVLILSPHTPLGWTFQGVTINNCGVGFDITSGATTVSEQTTGAEAIIDATVTNTPIFIRNSEPSSGRLSGSLVINNARLNNVPVAVGVAGGAVVLPGGTLTISSWGQGNIFTGTSSSGRFVQSNIVNANKPSVLLDGSGKIFGKSHPQYASFAVSQFVSVKDHGAKGDGRTDDTAALKAVFSQVRELTSDGHRPRPTHLLDLFSLLDARSFSSMRERISSLQR
jgi:glucan 1,3-beta-glucosidase